MSRVSGKRTARAKTVLDYDDIFFLYTLEKLLKKQKDTTNETHGIHFEILKQKMNMSHNALLNHLNRLLKFNLVLLRIFEGVEAVRRFEGKPLKYVERTKTGSSTLEYFLQFKEIKDYIETQNDKTKNNENN